MKRNPCIYPNREMYLDEKVIKHREGCYYYPLFKLLESISDDGRLTQAEMLSVFEIVSNIIVNVYKGGFIDGENYYYNEMNKNKDDEADNIKVNAAAYGCAAVLDRYNPNDKELELILEKIPGTWKTPEYK